MVVHLHLVVFSCLLWFMGSSAPSTSRHFLGTKLETFCSALRSPGSLSGPQQDWKLDRFRTSSQPCRRARAALRPPFLRRPFLFAANSFTLSAGSRRILKASVHWLQIHPEARVLIVGFCDPSGSETCTRTLAEARGRAIRKILDAGGKDAGQIVGVKAWDKLDRNCLPRETECQQLDRSAWIFIAGSNAP